MIGMLQVCSTSRQKSRSCILVRYSTWIVLYI